MEINLNDLASELTREEGLETATTVAQTKEKLGLLGARWRRQAAEDKSFRRPLYEFLCIYERAGLRSDHRSGDSVPDEPEKEEKQ